tara:strand:+ start:900 stop:1103 length:204 start_codon:yes stop_codon:yes gene_type:complete
LSKKKPSKKEIETVISNMIVHLRALEERVVGLDNLLGMYLQYKKENNSFQEFVNKKLEEAKGNEGNK